jgi:hypothetical protein
MFSVVTTMIAMSFLIVCVPAILSCIRDWRIVVPSVILTGITLAYMFSTLPSHNNMK